MSIWTNECKQANKSSKKSQHQQQYYKGLKALMGASMTHAPGQNRLSFNSPSKAAVVLTGAGMAFIRHPSRAGTLRLGVVSALSK